MWNWIKYLFIPRPIILPDPELVVAEEIHETKLDLLKAAKELEYWKSQVEMLRQRYARLRDTQLEDSKQ
jgi:hypothetical protein